MTSTQQDSSEFGVTSRMMKVEKPDKQTRRSWSPQEEAVLLSALKELVANGWKSDNGFRAAYLAKLEDAIAREFPGTDLKGLPYISSKLQIWKKNYGSLTLILKRIGVGFNLNGTHQIDCTKEQWDQIKKCDANAKTMRHKSWPMFEDWKYIFGKDRATGESAEGVMDAVQDMMQDKIGDEEKQDDDGSRKIPENISVDPCEENSTCHSEKRGMVDKSSGKTKKRKVVDPEVQCMADIFLSITAGTHERLDKLVSRVGYQYDQDEAKKKAFIEIEILLGLTLDQKFDLYHIFIEKDDRILISNGLSNEHKLPYLQRLLRQHRG